MQKKTPDLFPLKNNIIHLMSENNLNAVTIHFFYVRTRSWKEKRYIENIPMPVYFLPPAPYIIHTDVNATEVKHQGANSCLEHY